MTSTWNHNISKNNKITFNIIGIKIYILEQESISRKNNHLPLNFQTSCAIISVYLLWCSEKAMSCKLKTLFIQKMRGNRPKQCESLIKFWITIVIQIFQKNSLIRNWRWENSRFGLTKLLASIKHSRATAYCVNTGCLYARGLLAA